MTLAAASDEKAVCLKKKAGSSASNWSCNDHGTAPTTGDKVHVLGPVRPLRKIVQLRDESIGSDFPLGSVQNGGRSVEFSVESHLHYQATAEHLLIALPLGESAGNPSTPGGGTLSRDQAFTQAPNINGIACSFYEGPTASQTANQPSASIVPSAIAKGWTFSGEGDKPVKIKTDFCGIDVFQVPEPDDDPLSADITLTAAMANIAAATCLSTGRRIQMSDLAVYIDLASGTDDFASGDGEEFKVPVSRFEITFMRAQDYPTYASQGPNAVDGESRPIMPVNAGQLVLPKFTLQLPRYDSDLYRGRWTARTSHRVRFEFTGAEIESGFYQRLRIDFPNVILADHGLDTGANIGQTLTAECFQAPSTPTGFSSAEPIRVAVRNALTTNLMA